MTVRIGAGPRVPIRHADAQTGRRSFSPLKFGGLFSPVAFTGGMRGPWLAITSFWRVQARLPLEPWLDGSHVSHEHEQ